MARGYERTIRWKAIGIYMFIAVMCITVSVYIYNLSRNVRSQKQHIENYYDLLRTTNRVSFAISDAQSTANLYLTSKNGSHLASFRRKVAETELLIDSLTYLGRLTGDTSNLESLSQIGGLLRRKGDIIYRLNTQLVSYNPVDSIAQRLFIYDIAEEEPAVNDSVFLLGNRRDLWGAMSNVLIPGYRDSLITAYQHRADTVETVRDDSIKIAAGVRQYVEQVRTGYSSNIRELERQINTLTRTDQEITAQIIDVLNRFHRTTMQSTIRHIEESEETIRQNYRYSIGGIVLSLLLITVLVVLIISDANKGQSARLALERANSRIREIMASRHKLLLSVSHDIKTPLNAILGYLELWKQGGEAELSDIAAVELSGKHIGSLVNNLLEFSSLQQGISRPSPRPFDLREFCEETAGMILPLAHRKGLEFRTSFHFDHGLTVEADPMRLRQIVLNILSNAVKYTTEGAVNFKAEYESGKASFRICDTGSGMEPEELDNIFRPFSRLDSNRAMAEGHGYGMYVVKGLLELLEGDISVVSETGKGTTVTIAIPAPVYSDAQTDGAATGAKKIMFVDDDAVLLRVLASLAGNLGHTAVTTSDPGVIISGKTDLSGYDIVITDMEMGKTKGTQVLGAVKKRWPSLPVAVMTGHHDITAEVASGLGFDYYLPKPISQQSLATVAGNAGDVRPADPEPASLMDMFGDEETVREIIGTFIDAATDDMKSLRSAVFRRNHRKVRDICHRMTPLMQQFGAGECIEVLSRINGESPDTRGKDAYWRDVVLFIRKGSSFVDSLKQGQDA